MILASRDIIDSVDNAWWILTGVSAVLFIGIMGSLVWFVIKYHRSRRKRASNIHGNMKLEIAWTVLPTILSFYLFFVGYEGFAMMRDVPEDAMVVEVEARQWAFTFHYPKYGVSSSEMYVPVDTPIRCNLMAPVDDVLHSFYIPDYRTKEDCVPGLDTYMWFEPDVIATHNIFCAEFCGKDHARMYTTLHVLSQDDFEKKMRELLEYRFRPVTDVEKVMDPSSEELAAVDVKTLYTTYCASCHGAEGQGGLVEGARSFTDDAASKWKRGVKITDIFRTLTLGLDGTRMKAFDNLSAWDRFALSHYVADMHPRGKERSEASRAEYEKVIEEYKLDEQKSVILDLPIEEAMDELAGEAGG